MIRRLHLILCLSFCLAFPASAGEPAATLQGKVTWVYDGDTLEVESVGKVRLVGIDVPEREDSDRDLYLLSQGVSAPAQRKAYLAAKEFNMRQVKGEQVRLAVDSPERDRHGRLLAYMYLPDGRLLNRTLLEQGLAVVYRRFSFTMKEDFLAAERRARVEKRGLWANH